MRNPEVQLITECGHVSDTTGDTQRNTTLTSRPDQHTGREPGRGTKGMNKNIDYLIQSK